VIHKLPALGIWIYYGGLCWLLHRTKHYLMSRKIQFETWNPCKWFIQNLFIQKYMLYTCEFLPEQKSNSIKKKKPKMSSISSIWKVWWKRYPAGVQDSSM